MDQATATPMKRRLSLLATQCWQNITGKDMDSESPLMPKLENASPRSSMCITNSDAATCSGKSEKFPPSAIAHLDASLFEPIALVTPPKKRAKSEPSASGFDFHGMQRMSSLQYHSNFNLSNSYVHPFTATGMNMYQPQASMYAQSSADFMSPYTMNNRPQHGFTFAGGNSFDSTTMAAANTATVTPSTTSKGISASAATSDPTTLLDDFEPLFVDPTSASGTTDSSSDNDSYQCPDLCASSASMETSSSSLLDDGNIIISTSDSFKENNYAKAEIGIMNVLNPSFTMASNSIRNQLNCKKKNTPNAVVASKSKATSSSSNRKESPSRFKPFHEEKWNFHYGELLNFRKENGHCLVPHTFPSKPHLARWVKRQRRQYKLRLEGNKNSTMTEERIKILNDIGFVWDSHEVIWNERFEQLVAYKNKVGHCRVPSYCKDCPQLASWVKCQRRQYKLFWEEGKGSSMNMDRIKLLNSIGFIWEVHPGRKKKENDPHYEHLASILMES